MKFKIYDVCFHRDGYAVKIIGIDDSVNNHPYLIKKTEDNEKSTMKWYSNDSYLICLVKDLTKLEKIIYGVR